MFEEIKSKNCFEKKGIWFKINFWALCWPYSALCYKYIITKRSAYYGLACYKIHLSCTQYVHLKCAFSNMMLYLESLLVYVHSTISYDITFEGIFALKDLVQMTKLENARDPGVIWHKPHFSSSLLFKNNIYQLKK